MTEPLYCEYCDSDCYSASELFACQERCARETQQNRGYYKRKNPHRKD